MHAEHREGLRRPRTKGRGFTLLEFAVALAVFALIAGIVTLAVAQAQLASAGTRLDRAVRAEMTSLLVTASTGPYDGLAQSTFARPDPCTSDALASCITVLGRTFTVNWSVSAGSDLAGASTMNPSSVVLTTTTDLPGGRTVSASRTVVSPNGGLDENTGLVRVRMSGPDFEGPVYVVDATDAVVGSGVASGGMALLRASAADCTRDVPCRVALGPNGETSNYEVSLDARSAVGTSGQVVVSPASTTDVGVALLPVTAIEVALVAENDSGVRARPSIAGSICLYLTFQDGTGQVSAPACNDQDASLVRFSTYAPDPATPGRTVALPQGTSLRFSTDRPDGSCPAVESMVGFDGSTRTWVPAAVCTSWTWGPVARLQQGVTPSVAGVSVPVSIQAPESGAAQYQAIWSGRAASPAAGFAGETPWQFPRDMLACADLLVASCTAPSAVTDLPSPVTTYSYTGAVQSFTVPSGVQKVRVYAWGAGGGGGSDVNASGGAGGYSEALVNVSPGQTLQVVVGQGGMSRGHAQAVNGAGGGVSGVLGSWDTGNVDATQSSAIVLAGAGGGGGSSGMSGGNGGGSSGGASYSSHRPGTQAAGGVYPGSSAGAQTGNGSGSALRGGNGCGSGQRAGESGWPNEAFGGIWAAAAGGNGCNAAGGGGGYFGASGGTDLDGTGGSAGGGSGYVGGSGAFPASQGVTLIASVSQTAVFPPRTEHPYYVSGVGEGAPGAASVGSRAGNGLVVIEPLPAGSDLVPEMLQCPFRHCLSSAVVAPELSGPLTVGTYTVPSVSFTQGVRTLFTASVVDPDQAEGSSRISVSLASPVPGLELVTYVSGSPVFSSVSTGSALASAALSPAQVTLAYTGPVLGSDVVRVPLVVSDGTTDRQVEVLLYSSDTPALALPSGVVVAQGESAQVLIPVVSSAGVPVASASGVSLLPPSGVSVGALSVPAAGVLAAQISAVSAPAGVSDMSLALPDGSVVSVPVVVLPRPGQVQVTVSDVDQGGAGSVQAQVLDASAAPMSGADVTFEVFDSNGDVPLGVFVSPSGCRTSASGVCSVDVIAELAASSGEFTIVGSASGVASAGTAFSVLRSTARLVGTGARVMQGGAGTASVTALDGQGQVVSGVDVVVGPRPQGIAVGVSGPTGALGVATLNVTVESSVPADVYPVTVTVDGVSTTVRIEVLPTIDRVLANSSVSVPQGGNVNFSISVYDRAGAPVPGAVLTITASSPVRASSSVTTNANGIATVNLQAPADALRGTYPLNITTSEGVNATVGVFVAQGVASVTVMGDLARSGGTNVAFLLRDFQGGLVSGREVVVTSRSKLVSPIEQTITSDPRGLATATLTTQNVLSSGVVLFDLGIDGRVISVGVVVGQ